MPLRDSRLGSAPQHHRPHGSLPHPHCSQMRETEGEWSPISVQAQKETFWSQEIETFSSSGSISNPCPPSRTPHPYRASSPIPSLYRRGNWDPEREGPCPVSHSKSVTALVLEIRSSSCCRGSFPFPGHRLLFDLQCLGISAPPNLPVL